MAPACQVWKLLFFFFSFSFPPCFEHSERFAVTRLSTSLKREKVVMLQIMPSARVLGLMKLLMRNAICLRLLSPPPIACAPLPLLLLLLYGFFSTGFSDWWKRKGGGHV